MTGPSTLSATGSAQIREQGPALKFRSERVDILENNRRIGVVSQAGARQLLALGGYEPVGKNTIKYLRRIPDQLPADAPWKDARKAIAADNHTISQTRGANYHPRFEGRHHPWKGAPVAGTGRAE